MYIHYFVVAQTLKSPFIIPLNLCSIKKCLSIVVSVCCIALFVWQSISRSLIFSSQCQWTSFIPSFSWSLKAFLHGCILSFKSSRVYIAYFTSKNRLQCSFLSFVGPYCTYLVRLKDWRSVCILVYGVDVLFSYILGCIWHTCLYQYSFYIMFLIMWLVQLPYMVMWSGTWLVVTIATVYIWYFCVWHFFILCCVNCSIVNCI